MFYDEKWLKEKFQDANHSFETVAEGTRNSFSKAFENLDTQRNQLNTDNRLCYHDNLINRIEHKQDALFDCLLDAIRQIQIARSK
jgi:hypothetical protein